MQDSLCVSVGGGCARFVAMRCYFVNWVKDNTIFGSKIKILPEQFFLFLFSSRLAQMLSTAPKLSKFEGKKKL